MAPRISVLLWSQTDDWPALREAAVRADRAGVTAIWTWDHLNSIVGPSEGSILEGWTVLAGLAQVTERAGLGLMVGANTFRNPGLTAKLATTLDHLSGGRAILGIGGAWFEREHEAFGIDFGSGFGERLDRLDESVGLVRRLLDGETVTHEGRFYAFKNAVCAPRPIQAHLPLMIGGTGPTKTLRTLARYGDQWNAMGRPPKLREHDAVLRERCAEIGRDHREIERSTLVDLVIRDTREAAVEAYTARLARYGGTFDPDWHPGIGTPAQIAEGWQAYLDVGFDHLVAAVPAPQDLETIERIGEVLALLTP